MRWGWLLALLGCATQAPVSDPGSAPAAPAITHQLTGTLEGIALHDISKAAGVHRYNVELVVRVQDCSPQPGFWRTEAPAVVNVRLPRRLEWGDLSEVERQGLAPAGPAAELRVERFEGTGFGTWEAGQAVKVEVEFTSATLAHWRG